MKEPNYPNLRDLLSFVGAAAREVVEAAGPDLRTRAVGTGPFRVKEWKRGSRLILEANPNYREAYFPDSDRKEDADLVRSMKGRRVPFVGTVEVNIIDEDITRLLLFEQGGLDFVQLRGEIATRLLADGKLKPEYAARGITRTVIAEPFLFSLYFNMKDPVIGGMSNERIALRRAIALGWDADTLIKVVLADQAIPANQMIPPGVGGHDPELPVKSLYDPATARALLDRFGYDKRDPDGFRTRARRLAPDAHAVAAHRRRHARGADAVEEEHGGDRLADRVQRRAVPGDHQGPGEGEVPDVPGRLRRVALGLQRACAAARQAAAAGEHRAIRQCRLRPRRRRVSAEAPPTKSRSPPRARCPASRAPTCRCCRCISGWRATTSSRGCRGFRPGVFSSYWKYLDVDPARRK